MQIRISIEKINSAFVKKVEEISGQNLMKCNHCGKCSAGCPSIVKMECLPNQVIRDVQLGDESILEKNTIWLCASCFTCAVRCPKGVDLSKIMEALRLLTLRKNVDKTEVNELSQEELDELPPIAIVSNFRKMTS
jgi:heterodisulfide reductase subunit C